MFQSIYYCRTKGDIDQYKYFIRDDRSGINSFTYWPTVYKLDEEGEFETIFGDRCTALKGKYDRKDPNILEKDIDRELVLLRDLYYETDDIPSFHNILYLDIEIEIIGPLNSTTIKEANAELTSISLIDENTKEKICFLLDKKQEIESITDGDKKIISCKSEKELFLKFLNEYENIDPTIVVGWNSDFFDIPYLFYRGKKVVKDEIYRLSPIKKIEENPYSPETPIRIGLVNSLDYMLLFKKYITKQEESYRLGEIGKKYADLGKIEYEGSLTKLFNEDKQKFIEYNIRDVEILQKLEEKQKFLQLTIIISHLCHTPYESIHYNTTLNEGAILTYLKRKNIIAPNKPTTTNPSIKEIEKGDHVVNQRGTPTVEGFVKDINDNYVTIITLGGAFVSRNVRTIKKNSSYSGGYLLDPIPGLYSNLGDLDFSSLYPSIIKTLNLGVETLIGSIVNKDNYVQNNTLSDLKKLDPSTILQFQRLNPYSYELELQDISVEKLIRLIETKKWTIGASGAVFRTDKRSIACEVLEDWFQQREHYRGLKKTAGKNKDWVNYAFYDLYQHSFKIMQNALYGTYAINSWRFTDGFKICSSAITNSGQRLVKASIDGINDMIDEYIEMDIEDLKEIFDFND